MEKKPELPDCFVGNESSISDTSEISNRFNEYFVNTGESLASKNPDSDVNISTFLGEISINLIFLHPIMENEVGLELSKLNGTKSCGHDEICRRREFQST